jgi:hypothetical protein
MDVRAVAARLRRIAKAQPQATGSFIGTVGLTVVALVRESGFLLLLSCGLWVVAIIVLPKLWRNAADDDG